jgi:hypothetical protein
MLRYVELRCAALRGVQTRKYSISAYIFVMSFLRIKTITKNGKTYRYLVQQTNVRKGKKVYSIMEHICGFGLAFVSPGKPGGFSGSRPTDKRQIRDQETADRELFVKNRAAFNVKLRQEYERQNKGKLREEPVETAKDRKVKESVREFNEARAKEKEPPGPRSGS